jgi:tetratricopeptide (TPR) repeat protein
MMENQKKSEDKQTSSPSAQEYYKQGNELSGLKKYAESLVAYDTALALNPQYAAAYNNRGYALQALGRHVEALTAYDAALAINPQYAAAHRNRGNVLLALERDAEALTAYNIALAIDPQRAVAHHNCGVALHALGRLADALVAFDAAIAIDPQHATFHRHRGETLAALGQHNKAKNAYLAVLAINGGHLQAKTNFQLIAGKSYESYKAEKMKELCIKLATVASEIGMFKRGEKVHGVPRVDSQAEVTQLPENKEAQNTIKTDSQTEENNILKIILDYAVCPPENEDSQIPESKSSCCIS